MRQLVILLIIGILFMPLSANTKVYDPQCSDKISLKAWIKTIEKQYSKKEFNPEQLRKLYLENTPQSKTLTLFYPKIFESKVLTSNLAIDCHNNLYHALTESGVKAQPFIELWKSCVHNLYENRADQLVNKAVSCLKK